MGGDGEQGLRARVEEAARARRPVAIVGGGSKAFYGRRGDAETSPICTAEHCGVTRYDPAELVVTARAGTPLAEVEKLLADENQMLGFEPPHFGDGDGGGGESTTGATIGGAVATGLSGPRRPFAGAARDFVLGVKLINGSGEVLRFGGEVMKNVAGFDVARLMTGALGTLGVLLEISLRVVPRPPVEKTLRLEHAEPAAAVALFNRLAARPLPLSGAAWDGGATRIRLSGLAAGARLAAAEIGGEVDANGDSFWRKLRDHELAFFRDARELLRVSLPPAAAFEAPPGAAQLVDWGGAQRWLINSGDCAQLRATVAERGGHVTRFRRAESSGNGADGGDRGGEIFHPLPAPLRKLHRELKRAFDPAGILNPGRLSPDF